MPHTLLLADDSVTIQRVVELTFAGEDISVVSFSDGNRAMASLDSAPPDIVLADVGMPGPSGYDLARHIRQTPSLAHIPVLLMTGAFEPVDQERARDVKCDGVLTKPFEPKAVVQRVRELLTGGAGAAQQPAQSVAAAAPVDSVPSAPPSALDQYFEQLDRAIAVAARTPRADDAPKSAPAPAPVARTEEPRPILVDAFSALLAAEESDAADPAAAIAPLLAPPAPAPINQEAIVEEVVKRVLAAMTDRVVRDTVADIASKTTERLVVEEIERIKSNIK